MEFIEWCNNNEGFIGAILSILTIIVSIIALYTSIRLAYIPYKKRLLINPVFGFKQDKYYLELMVANSGNKLVGISYILVNYKKSWIGGNDKQKFIKPSQTKKFFIELDLNENDTKFDNNPQIEILICDTEKKEYKFKTALAMG